jgi:ribose 5-phosphate isomerase A
MGGLSGADGQKRAAAEAAVALVEDGMLLGLGTGSTMVFAVDALGRRVREQGLRVRGVATSVRTEEQARALGIPLTDFASVSALDLAIDGADEVEAGTLRLIKGLGGALLREKIVAEAARRFVVVADAGKVVARLGERAPVPVEVVRFGHEVTARRLSELGGAPVLRSGSDKAPFVTDNGNLIYDCHTGPVADARAFGAALKGIAGVVESGLFLDGVEQAIIGESDGSVRVLRPSL